MRRILLLAVLLGSPLVSFAANEVEVSGSVTLILPSDSSRYTLTGKFDSLEVNNASFSFVISHDSSFVEIVSPDKKKLSADTALDKSLTCRANDSLLRVNFGPDDVSQTVTVTPSGTCGGDGGGTGILNGGGGGGGGPAYEPAPQTAAVVSAPVSGLAANQIKAILDLLRSFNAEESVIANVQAALTKAPVSSISSAGVSASFSRGLSLGARGEDVKRLQQLLNSDPDTMVDTSGVGAPGNETEYFGSLTRSAVQKFQEKHSIAGPGVPGYGLVGPKTRAKLLELYGE